MYVHRTFPAYFNTWNTTYENAHMLIKLPTHLRRKKRTSDGSNRYGSCVAGNYDFNNMALHSGKKRRSEDMNFFL